MLVGAQAPLRGVNEDLLAVACECVRDDVVDPLAVRRRTLRLDEVLEGIAVVLLWAANHSLHALSVSSIRLRKTEA
jgi:hypothetical protein